MRARIVGPLLLLMLLTLPALGEIKDGRVDLKAVVHDPDGLDQLLWATAESPALRFLFLRLGFRADDVMTAGARIYHVGDRDYEAFRDQTMEPYATADSIEYRSITLPFQDDPTAGPLRSRWRGYRLWLDDGDELYWVGRDTIATGEEKVQRFGQLFRPQKAGVEGGEPPAAAVSDRIIYLPAWVADAVFYQILPDRFRNGDSTNDPDSTLAWGTIPTSPTGFCGGDLKGILDALPYLDSLGVTAIYLNPIFTAKSSDRYDPVNYKEVDPHLGGTELLKQLVAEVHRRKMKIILDGVFDHSGLQHPYFQDVEEWGSDSQVWAWFRAHGYPLVKAPRPNYDCWEGRPDRPLWNTDNPEVRDYMFDVVRLWMEMGIDGWRVDSPEGVGHAFWIQFRQAAKAMDPRSYLVGRVHGSPTPWLAGDELDAVRNDEFRQACIGFFADSTLDARAFDEALARIRIHTPDPLNRITYNFLGDHDTPRFLTVCGGNEARFRLAVLFQMCYLGAPAIYYGDEIGLRGGPAPACRGTFSWRLRDQNAPLREYFRYLLAIRKEHPGLRRGGFTPLVAKGGHYVFMRRSSEEIFMVVINRTGSPASFKLPVPKGVGGTMEKNAVDLLTGAKYPMRSGEISIKDVPAMSGAIVQLK